MGEGKWVKNGLLLVAVLVMMVALVGGELLWSYWQGMQGMVRSGLRDATSIEFDLARLDKAIEALTPVLQENKRTAAELEVEIDYLDADTQKLEAQQALAQAEMQELRQALDDSSGQLRIDGRLYSRSEVEEDLLRRLQAYEQTDQHLQMRWDILAKRKENLRRAVSSTKQAEQQQQMLAQQAAALDAELRMLKTAAASGGFSFKQPDLASAQQLLAEIEKKIRVLHELGNERDSAGSIPVNLERRTATQRFDELFPLWKQQASYGTRKSPR